MIKSREIVVDTIFAERSPKKANESLEATSQSKIKIRGNFSIKLFGPKMVVLTTISSSNHLMHLCTGFWICSMTS